MASSDVKRLSGGVPPLSAPLPQGWIQMQDPSGSDRPLYCNPSTGQTSWARPVVRVLPPGWIKSQTPDGKAIFIHPETQRCSFEWPQADQKAPLPQAQMPHLDRSITTPGTTPVQPKPDLLRSQTTHSPASHKPMAAITSVNAALAPSSQATRVVPQMPERTPTRALSSKFTSDLVQTTSAMKEVTISGSVLAARQAKVVGETLVSRRKMVKASKKMVVHTGAFGVKTGRAMKGLMSEMVDAADKKGKYQPKVNASMSYGGQTLPQGTMPSQSYDSQHQQQHTLSAQTLPSSAATGTGVMPTTVPARKPVRLGSTSANFSASHNVQHNASGNVGQAAAFNYPHMAEPSVMPPSTAVQAQGLTASSTSPGLPSYAEATNPSTPAPNPPGVRPPRKPVSQPASIPFSGSAATSGSPMDSTAPGPVQQQADPSQNHTPGISNPPAAINPPVVQYIIQSPPSQQPGYGPNQIGNPFAQGLTAPAPQPVTIQQNQTTVVQQSTSSDTTDLMLAQLQMAMTQQQSTTSNQFLQQTPTTQPVMVDQSVYVDQSQYVNVDTTTVGDSSTTYIDQTQYVDVENTVGNPTLGDTATNTYVDYTDTTEVVTFVDPTDGEVYVTSKEQEGVVYVQQDATTGEFYEVEYQDDNTTGAVLETADPDLGLQDTDALCF